MLSYKYSEIKFTAEMEAIGRCDPPFRTFNYDVFYPTREYPHPDETCYTGWLAEIDWEENSFWRCLSKYGYQTKEF